MAATLDTDWLPGGRGGVTCSTLNGYWGGLVTGDGVRRRGMRGSKVGKKESVNRFSKIARFILSSVYMTRVKLSHEVCCEYRRLSEQA